MDDLKRATLLPWQADPSGWFTECRASNKTGRMRLRAALRRALRLNPDPDNSDDIDPSVIR